MTSIGRGRGWASAQNKEAVLRRPGATARQTFDCASLINDINQIELEHDLIQMSNNVMVAVSNLDKESTKDLIAELYLEALKDRKFAVKLVGILLTLIEKNRNQNAVGNVRYWLINNLQTNFEGRVELREGNAHHFRNAVYMLFEVLHRYRANDKPFGPFQKAAIGYLLTIVEKPEPEDLEVIVEQMTKYGKILLKEPLGGGEWGIKKAIDDAMISVRKTLITGNLSSSSRAMLLYILDLVAHDCEPLSKELCAVYSKHSGSNGFLSMENDTEDVGRIENNAVPRAIRGSGAVTNQKPKLPQKKPRANGPPSQRRSSERKGWDHDDRLERDYE